jgi:hypothetical protein
MQEKDIQGILRKVEEMKTVFTFGVKFVPFLEDLFLFVKEMAPMLNEMNMSIQESSAKMPKAVQQLDKVTSATEMATHEILDKIEDMLNKLGEIGKSFEIMNKRMAAEQEAIAGITSSIEELLKLPKIRKSLSKVFEDEKTREQGIKIKDIVDKFLAEKVDEQLPEKVTQLLNETQSDAYGIMNSLQVQDITAQQIQAAHAMLRSIQERLNEIILKYSEAEPPEMMHETQGAFDENATYFKSEERQNLVDEIEEKENAAEAFPGKNEIEEKEEGKAAVAESQAEIDSLFNQIESAGLEAEEMEKPESQAFDYSAGEIQSQEEIDSLVSEDLVEEKGTAGEEVREQTPQESGEAVAESPGSAEFSLDEELEESGEALAGESTGIEGLEKPQAEAPAEEEPAQGAQETDEALTDRNKEGEEKAGESGSPDQIKISQEEIDKLFQ